MTAILTRAWIERNRKMEKAWKLKSGLVDALNEANDSYRDAVYSLFTANSLINWTNGVISGQIAPIPPSEVGL